MTTFRTHARFTALVGLSLAALSAQALELRGFRGVAWGSSAEALGEARQVQREGDVACYERSHENLVFGEQPVRRIRYCFNKDQLFLVTLDAATGPKAMTAEFALSYGPPRARGGERASWGDTKTLARAELVASPTAAAGSRLTLHSNRFEPELFAAGH